jgi:hypothetical protein
MPLSTTMVGASTPPMTHDVDARWIMSYAAGLGDGLVELPAQAHRARHATTKRIRCALMGSLLGLAI